MDLANFITVIVSLIVGAGSSYITFRLQFERFQAMDERREQDWVNWRNKIDRDIDVLKASASVTELKLLQQMLQTLSKSLEDLWKYTTEIKHVHVDPYQREVSKLAQRIDALERR
jgi:hypothetical protein